MILINEKSYNNSKYKICRYSDNALEVLRGKYLLEDVSDNCPYQGCLEVYCYDKDKKTIIYLEYGYGSCSGCDDWERRDLSYEEIVKEIKDLILEIKIEDLLKKELKDKKELNLDVISKMIEQANYFNNN